MAACHLYPCGKGLPVPVTRRQMLAQSGSGFAALACAALLHDDASAVNRGQATFRPRAKHVIFLHMDGGVSHIDTFDPKPRLDREHGQPIKIDVQPTQFNSVGPVMKSPWKFHQHGQSGMEISELFPHIATCADNLCLIRSMVSDFSEHTAANYFLHTGSGLQGRPSMGAWLSYGLGTENRDLPSFLVVNGGQLPVGGVNNFAAGFLPPEHEGSRIRMGDPPLANIVPADVNLAVQRRKLTYTAQLDRRLLHRASNPAAIEAAIANQELAYRMQSAVPELLELREESDATMQLYGLNSPNDRTSLYARQCLIARRMVERGVRFVEITMPVGAGEESRWDQHGKIFEGHGKNALAVDQPIAGLLKDLQSRGLLDETLVIWAGEFGRTPFSQVDGRDHHPHGFSIWMAGGGTKGGMTYGATDDYGYYAIKDKIHVHDLHATILHLLGVNHKELIYRFGGRDFRLTDVHGYVAHDIIA